MVQESLGYGTNTSHNLLLITKCPGVPLLISSTSDEEKLESTLEPPGGFDISVYFFSKFVANFEILKLLKISFMLHTFTWKTHGKVLENVLSMSCYTDGVNAIYKLRQFETKLLPSVRFCIVMLIQKEKK